MLQDKKKHLKHLWQLSVIVACLSTIMLLFTYSNQLNKRNYKMLYDQTESLSRLLLRQSAATAYPALEGDNLKPLNALIKQLEAEPLILDATIYDVKGNLLANSSNSIPLDQLTGVNTPLSVASIGRQQLVEPITNGSKLVGFIRITLEHGELIKDASNRLEQNINLVRFMLLIALSTGALLIFTITTRIDVWLSRLALKTEN